MNFIKPNLKSLPEQVDINTNDIKNLKSVLKSSYKTEKELEPTTITILITDTNAPQGTTSGWIFDSVGHLFSINGGDDTNLLLEYYTSFRGPAGIDGVAIVQTTGSSTESVMSQNAVTTELESKANIDASNLSSENVTSWSNKLGIRTITTELENKANIDASNLSNENVTSWNNKLGIRTITTELENKANIDASNLSSENVTSWANKFFPVGSIYMSVNNTSPASFLGGTWEQIKDTFLLGAGDTYTNGATGGESTHTLTVDEMPAHNHNISYGGYYTIQNSTTSFSGSGEPSFAIGPKGSETALTYVTNTGGSQSHNNMPPYLAVYMWKRTA